MERFPKKGLNTNEGSSVQHFQYEYFDSRHERHDIYEFCKELATYLKEKSIKNVVFLDRSARPAWIGVDEYWNQHFKDEPKPGFFFINPDGFKAMANRMIVDIHEVASLFVELIETGKLPERASRSEDDITRRFSEVHTTLFNEMDESVVLFDTCAHTGNTMRDVHSMFEKMGFRDVQIVTANEPDFHSEIKPDTVIDWETRLTSCYPFGNESLVRKTDDVVSEPEDDEERKYLGKLARKEIRMIMQDEDRNQ